MAPNLNGNANTNGAENTTTGGGSNQIDVSNFWERYDFLKLSDQMKNLLLEVCTIVLFTWLTSHVANSLESLC